METIGNSWPNFFLVLAWDHRGLPQLSPTPLLLSATVVLASPWFVSGGPESSLKLLKNSLPTKLGAIWCPIWSWWHCEAPAAQDDSEDVVAPGGSAWKRLGSTWVDVGRFRV